MMYEYLAYVGLGLIVMITSFYLHIYYATHCVRITRLDPNGSKYFRALSNVFIPIGLYGLATTISGMSALLGFRLMFLDFVPYITITVLLLFAKPLICFCKATSEE